MTERATTDVPTARPGREVLPWTTVLRLGVAAGLCSHLPWLLASRLEPVRTVSTLMPFVFLAFDPWLTVPLVVRVRDDLAGSASSPGARTSSARAGVVVRAALAGTLSGTIAGASIVVWERVRLGAWLPTADVLAHLVYPLLAAAYASIAVGVAILVPRAHATKERA